MRIKVISCVICALMIATLLVIEVPKGVGIQITEEWAARYDAANDEDGSDAIAIDSLGNVYVTGWSYVGEYSDYLTVAYDPSGNELWTARYNGPANSEDCALDIDVDISGNVYVTGGISIKREKYHSIELYDIATVAYDSNGNQLWVALYNGPGNGRDYARAITIGPNGNIFVTGESRGVGTNYDYSTLAYDSNGNLLWVARYNGPGNDIDGPRAISIDDTSGNIFVTGRSTDIDGQYDYATVAYDSSGNQLWVARYDGPGNREHEAYAIVLDSSGNIYVTGESDGGSYYSEDFATIAYDSSGNQLWVARTEFTERSGDCARDIAVDNSGRIYVTGGTQSIDPWKDYDYLTVAYDSDGNQLWFAKYNGLGDEYDRARGISVDLYGNVYVTGRSRIGFPSDFDYVTIAYDSSGNQLWIASYNGPANGEDHARSIAIDSIGNVYVTGFSKGSETSRDICTVKYPRQIPIIQASIDIDPNTLNLKSKGRWITCYITLNSPYDVNDVDISTILLEDTIPAEWGDIQGDTLMVKFDRSDVEDMLSPGTYNLKVTGKLTDGTKFEGYSDEIRVIDPP